MLYTFPVLTHCKEKRWLRILNVRLAKNNFVILKMFYCNAGCNKGTKSEMLM